MNERLLHDSFIKVIKNKIPERGRLANVLADILVSDKEAIYRRLRGEVPFTFAETVKIAQELDISLDNIIGRSQSKNRPFQMRMIDFERPTETDFIMQEHYADMLVAAADDPGSESGLASNVIPINLCMCYEHLYRFYFMKWTYQLGNQAKKYNEIQLPQRQIEMNRTSVENIQKIANTYYIWNDRILHSLIDDIKYFATIRLISTEEIELLKQDIARFINDFEQLAITGTYATGKKAHIFISRLNFETSYSYIETKDYKLSIIRSFTLNDTISLDLEVFGKIKKWMQSLVRTSTLISGSNERERIIFFEKQRNLLATYL